MCRDLAFKDDSYNFGFYVLVVIVKKRLRLDASLSTLMQGRTPVMLYYNVSVRSKKVARILSLPSVTVQDAIAVIARRD